MNSIPDDDKKQKNTKNNEYLSIYINHLEKRIRDLEVEQQENNSLIKKLRKKISNLRLEINRLKKPPLFTGIVTDILDDNKNRVIVSSSTGPSLIVENISKIKKRDLTPGKKVALNQQTMAVTELLPSKIEPFIQSMELIENIPNISYDDIGGLADQIQEVRETVELPLINPSIFEKVGIDPPKGVLLYGPPGNGKTLVAKAIAHEIKATFIRIIGSELVQKFIGEGARYVREIFELARKKAPTILFIDELDAIGAERLEDPASGDREVQRTLMQLMAELDGFNKRGNVRVVGATNRVDILDHALLRPGRFDRIIYFPIPDDEARGRIFKVHIKKLNIVNNINIKMLIKMSEGATGADIKAICTEAGMFAIRNNQYCIREEHFVKAINKVLDKKKFKSLQSKIYI